MVAPFPVTRVRYDEAEGREVALQFLGAGHLAPWRPPRGVDPIVVRDVILETIGERSGMSRVRRALECMRFYETEEAAPQLALTFAAPLHDVEDVARGCFATQAAVDTLVVDPALATRAARYFDEVIVPHPSAFDAWPVLVQTATLLAPFGSAAALLARLHREIAEAQVHESTDEAWALRYDMLCARRDNDVPRMERDIELQQAAAALSDRAQQIGAWVEQYVGRAAVSEAVEVRAARRLRAEASTSIEGRALVHDALRGILYRHTPGHEHSASDDQEIGISVQALSYLGAELTETELQLYRERQSGITSFLHDA